MQLPGEFSPFIEKKVVFCLVVWGVYPPYTLSGPTTKKILFLCVSSLAHTRVLPPVKVHKLFCSGAGVSGIGGTGPPKAVKRVPCRVR